MLADYTNVVINVLPAEITMAGVSDYTLRSETAIAGKNRGIGRQRAARHRSYAAAMALCAAA